VRILGPVSHCGPHGVTALRGKAAALLTTLVLHANRPVTLDLLTEVLWDGEPPRSAVANLRTYVHTLREVFGGGPVRVEGHSGGYVLCLDPADGDYLRFGELVAQAKAATVPGSPLKTVELLERALELWLGDGAAPGVARYGPLAVWLDAVEEERRRTVESLAEARIALGEARLAARELSILLARSPLRDRAWWLRIWAHHTLGEYHAVVASYQAAVRHFHSELGIAPSAQLTDLYRSLVLEA
jgi:DNA-binding SARP family transcriptional activator